MIAKRIPHKTQCDHAQTPYARRKCRKAQLANAIKKQENAMRYTIQQNPAGTWDILDNSQPIGLMFSNLPQANAQRTADNLNASANTPAVEPAPSRTPRTGWSNASRRRSNGHPLGRVTARGNGYTEYEDDVFGGGRVQIWDRS